MVFYRELLFRRFSYFLMKYSTRHHRIKRPRQPLRISKKQIIISIIICFLLPILYWLTFQSTLFKIQKTEFITPSDFNCLNQSQLLQFDQSGKSIFLFNTSELEQEIKKNNCIEDVFIELTPSRVLKVSFTMTRSLAGIYINPKLQEIYKIATSSIDLRSSTVSAILKSSSIIDTNKDLNSRSLTQIRVASDSSLPKFYLGDDQKNNQDFSNFQIIPILNCLSENLIQSTSFVLINQRLVIYNLNVNNGFTTLDAKLLINPEMLPQKFCITLQEIIQKSTIDGIKLDSIDLRFKDPVVNILK